MDGSAFVDLPGQQSSNSTATQLSALTMSYEVAKVRKACRQRGILHVKVCGLCRESWFDEHAAGGAVKI